MLITKASRYPIYTTSSLLFISGIVERDRLASVRENRLLRGNTSRAREGGEGDFYAVPSRVSLAVALLSLRNLRYPCKH